jgi:adenosylhomocysteine nucleosidase
MSIVAVTGMQREAKLLRSRCDVVVAGSDNSALASKIEVAIARGAKGIFSFGICGALSPELEIGSVVVGAEVVCRDERRQADEAWTAVLISACDAAAGVVAGSDSVLLMETAKAALHLDTGAAAADMESHIVARVAAAHKLPFAVLRAVSDAVHHTLPPAAAFGLNTEGRVDYSAVMLSLLDDPSQISALIRTARDTSTAMKALLRCLELLGPGLGCPYLV